jgi:membrane protein required for colicin V production
MNPLDIAVIAVVALSAIFAFARGFVREALSIVAWAGAAAATWYGADYAKSIAAGFFADELLARLVGLGVTFVAALIALTIVTSLIARLIRRVGMSGLDRTLGFIFGLARGAFLVCLAYLLLDLSLPQANDRPGWIREAKSGPYLHDGANALKGFLPESLKAKSTEAAGEMLRSFDPKAAAKSDADKAMRAYQTPSPPAGAKPESGPTYRPGEQRELDRVIGNQR